VLLLGVENLLSSGSPKDEVALSTERFGWCRETLNDLGLFWEVSDFGADGKISSSISVSSSVSVAVSPSVTAGVERYGLA